MGDERARSAHKLSNKAINRAATSSVLTQQQPSEDLNQKARTSVPSEISYTAQDPSSEEEITKSEDISMDQT